MVLYDLPVPTQGERRDHTTAAIMAAAHRLFAENGFDRTSIVDIATEAGVTKGSVYHYFDTKEALFQRVLEEVNAALAPRILEEVATRGEMAPAEALKLGCRLFLEYSLEPGIRRILLIDGPRVLGWELWREIDSRYFLTGLRAGLEVALPPGRDATIVSHLLVGAVDEAVMMISQSADPSTAVTALTGELDRIIDALLT